MFLSPCRILNDVTHTRVGEFRENGTFFQNSYLILFHTSKNFGLFGDPILFLYCVYPPKCFSFKLVFENMNLTNVSTQTRTHNHISVFGL